MKPTVSPVETIPWALPDLVAFLRVVDHASFSRAAAVLGESKGMVSKRVARLERAVGAVLLQRTSRSVALTEAGTYFREAALAALETLGQATYRVRQGQDEPEGTLRLTAPHDLARDLLPPIIGSFLSSFPRVRVELVPSDAMLDLAAHRLDLALRATDALADSSYVANRLTPLELGLFAAPEYLRVAGTPRGSLAQLGSRHRLLLRLSDARASDGVWLQREGGSPERVPGRPGFQATSFAPVVAAAIEGLGIACLPEIVARRAVRERRLRRVLPAYAARSAHLYLIHAKGLLPARVRAFRDHVQRALV
jgi:DNA-binding transcriptional LysR family regulator